MFRYPKRLFNIFLLALALAIMPGCSQTNEDKAEIERYRSFLDKEWGLFVMHGNPRFIYRVDSFYAQQKNIPPFCVFLKCSDKTLYYQRKDQLDSALVYNDSCLKILTLNGLDKKYIDEYISDLNFRGELLYGVGNYSEAYNFYFAAKQLTEQMKDTCLLSQYKHNTPGNDIVQAEEVYRRNKLFQAVDSK